MLTTLRIKNLALVTDLTLELQPGCNVITGETGAGKSIIIGALNLVLGERADRTLIRSGEESCSVEAVFDVSKLRCSVRPVAEPDRAAGSTLHPQKAFKDLILRGPAPAPLLRAETFYRYQIMLRTRAMSRLSQALAKIIGTLVLPEDVTLAVDIDPVNLG
jgi:energy-coupling factor transporter ATP-binding protein EcfA2